MTTSRFSKRRNPVSAWASQTAMGVLALFAASSASAGILSAWNGIGANDSLGWSALGGDGNLVPQNLGPLSSVGGIAVSGNLANGTGLVAVQCVASPSCSWTGGFTAGDSALWSFNGSNGAGPLTLSLGTAVTAAGLWIQADAAAQFTAQIQVLGADTGSFSVTSNANGDPVFIGAQDTAAGISSFTISLTGCGGGCDLNDFAVDTLQLLKQRITTNVPEPASIFLFVGSLVGMGWQRLRQRRNSGQA